MGMPAAAAIGDQALVVWSDKHFRLAATRL
jgi:hypothetical protein